MFVLLRAPPANFEMHETEMMANGGAGVEEKTFHLQV